MLGAGHANLAPLVGQQISQLSSLVGGHAGSQQSPPGLGHNSLNVMLAQQQHGQQVTEASSPEMWLRFGLSPEVGVVFNPIPY